MATGGRGARRKVCSGSVGSSHHAATAPMDRFRPDAASRSDCSRLGAVGRAIKINDRCCQELPLKVLVRGGPQCWQSVYAGESPCAQRPPQPAGPAGHHLHARVAPKNRTLSIVSHQGFGLGDASEAKRRWSGQDWELPIEALSVNDSVTGNWSPCVRATAS